MIKFNKYPNNLKVEDVKARKKHSCGICGRSIDPKEVYTIIKQCNFSYGYNSFPVSLKMCLFHDVNKLKMKNRKIVMEN